MADYNACPHAPFKSIPLYPPIHANTFATRHIVVCDGTCDTGHEDLRNQLGRTADVTWLSIGEGEINDPQQLRLAFTKLLKLQTIGVQLYLFAEQALIWELHASALDHGISTQEIALATVLQRQQQSIYCVHCSTLQVHPVLDTVTCKHCRVELEVRAHFSRRMGAYLGVCRNGNQPYGEGQP